MTELDKIGFTGKELPRKYNICADIIRESQRLGFNPADMREIIWKIIRLFKTKIFKN